MSIEVKYALRPCVSVGFAGYCQNDPLKGVIRGDLAWCMANPTCVDLYRSGVVGLTGGHKSPGWLPIKASLNTLYGAQLTGHISVNLKDFNISSSLHPWLRLSAVAAANLATALMVTEVAAVTYALYDPFSSNRLVLVTGIGAGIGVSPPVDLGYLFSILGLEIRWMGELLVFFETQLALSRDGNGKSYGQVQRWKKDIWKVIKPKLTP